MWFGKKILLKLATALAVVVPAMAADVAPLYFDGIDDSKQQGFWEDLMKYKMFGAEGISFAGQQILVPDKSGWFGTAAGDFNMRSGNNKHTIGGPVLVGGNLIMSDGNDSITSGPVRVLGDIKIYTEANWRNSANLILGTQCVYGDVNQEYVNAYKAKNNGADVYAGETYGDCPSSVPQINTELRIPKLGTNSAVVYPAINTNNNRDQIKNAAYPAGHPTIDVPKGAGTYDIIIDYIQFANENLLEIRMPYGGRLTRIFLTNGFVGGIPSHNQILVSYMDKDAEFDDEKLQWVSGTATQVKNQDYAGNLLFYTTKDIDWAAMQKGDVIQGTFISTGTITVRQSMTLAGQLLANNINVDAFFDGSGFRYVPFDPPILGFTPEVLASLVFKENDTFVPVPVKLSEKTKVNVYFDYCFEFLTNEYTHVATLEDITIDPSTENPYPFPLCANNESAQVVIWADNDSADVTSRKESIHINVKIDDELEPEEKIRLRVMNLTGAVLDGNLREGYFDLTLQDAQKNPSTKPDSIHVVEDVEYVLPVNKFYYRGMYEQKGITITVLPAKGTLTLLDEPVVAGTFVSKEQLENGDLKYVNALHEYSGNSLYTTFTFTVIDVEGNSSVSRSASDLGLISIYVAADNDAPSVAENQEMSVDENAKNGSVVETFVATDVDGDVLTYAFDKDDANYATVSSIFAIDSKTGVVTVKDGSKLDFESGVTSYSIKVKVTDNASTTNGNNIKTSTGPLTINVNDVNEPQTVKEIAWTIKEGDKYATYPSGIGSIADSLSDEDLKGEGSAVKEWRTYSYTIVENNDADKANDVPFYLNAKTGVLKIDNKESVNIDFETVPEYTFHVLVKDSVKLEDGSYGQFEYTTLVTIKVEDLNEPTEILVSDKPYNVFESTVENPIENGTVFASIEVKDPDAGEVGEMKVSLTDNNKTEGVVSAEDLFGARIIYDSGKKTWTIKLVTTDATKLDYEKLYNDHYSSEDKKVVFNVTLTTTDYEGKATSVETKIVVDDVNESPSAEDGSFDVDEKAEKGTVVGTIPASDPDVYNPAYGTLYFSVVEEGVPFEVANDGSNNGKITVAEGADLDFEIKSEYKFHVQVTDGETTPTVVEVVVKVNDIPEKPQFTDKEPTMKVDENTLAGTLVGTLEVTDDDCKDGSCTSFSFELIAVDTAAGDVNFFVIDNTGKITVKADSTLNYEADSLYYVKAVVYDGVKGAGGTLSDTAFVTIKINDVNDAPVIADKELSVPENSKKGDLVGTIEASDEDTWSELTYTLADVNKNDAVASLFAIDNNGKITVAKDSVLDYETRDEYKVLVIVKDNGLAKGFKDLYDTAVVTIKINDVDERPGFDDKNPVLAVDENSPVTTYVGTVTATDDDCKDNTCGALSYELIAVDSAASDVNYFTIDNSGKITVKKEGLNYEVDSLYYVKVVVYDGDKGAVGTLTDTAFVTIKINDVNDAPVIADAEMTVHENAVAGDSVGVINGTDEDTWSKLTYKLADVNSADAVAKLFTIDNNGKVSVAKGAAFDFESRDEYKVLVIVTDNGSDKHFENLSDTAVVTIHVADDPEKPEIVDDGKTKYDVEENSLATRVVAEFVVKDPDGTEVTSLVPSIIDRDDAGADTLFRIALEKSGDDWKIVVRVAKDSVIDYEGMNKSYNVTFKVVDDADLSAEINRVINIVDVNEPHIVRDINGTKVDEKSKNGTVVDTLKVDDEDTNPAFRKYSYEIIEGNGAFALDSKDPRVIVVADSTKLNYEGDSIITFKVRVYDNMYTDTAVITIKLKDVPENPVIITEPECDENDPDCHKCDAMIADCGHPNNPPSDDCEENCGYIGKGDTVYVKVKENTPTGTTILEYLVKDEDKDDVEHLIPSFVSINNSGADSLFDISMEKVGDDYKVVLKVAADLDYETVNELHKLQVIVTDPSGLADTVVRIIQVVDVNEAPIIVKQEFEFNEHNTVGSVVDTIKWGDDLDTKDPSFRDNKVVLVGGDTDKFDVDPSGVITTKTAFNYETDDSTYILIVKVVDKKDPTLFVDDTMHITLKNVPEVPHITSTEFDIDENPKDSAVVGVIVSKDLDDLEDKEDRKFEMTTPSSFVTVTEDGKIIVKDKTKFDYESTSFIKIDVKVTDPTGESSDTTIVIKINDVNEEPSINDQTIHVSENAKVGSVVDTVKASDPDKNPEYSTLTYTVIGGDTTVFKVDPKTGEVVLKDSLDYEKKTQYELVVSVSDGTYTDTATITIKVDNEVETADVEIILVENSDTSWTFPKEIYTNNPEGTITWVQNGDTLHADSTFHPGKNVIIITYDDPTMDNPGADTLIVYFSSAAPVVVVSANADDNEAKNIYTIVEKTDDKDTSIYVNSTTNNIYVTVKDTVTHTDSTFVVRLELDTVSVDKEALSSVIKSASDVPVLNLNPKGSVSRTPINGSEISVSYVEKVSGNDSVTVTYRTDNEGNVIKSAVVGADGKIDSVEVITVSYVKVIKGKEVVVSYQADAEFGKVLMTDAEGNLMTVEAAESIASSSSQVAGSSSSQAGSAGSSDSKPTVGRGGVGSFTVTYDYVDARGNTATVSYVIDEEGNIVKNAEGNIGYTVSYTYTNKYGNAATQSVFIVLDQNPPVVKISYPTYGQIIYSNYVTVTWTVNGVEQDTLTIQGLEDGTNAIVRFYRDKAGNEASDTVFVVMKDGKNVDIALEQPVTQSNLDKVDEYYAVNQPEEGETFAVSIKNPSTGKEVETLKGGNFDTKKGSGDAPYPGLPGHLGPTMSMDIRLPVVNDVGGMATLDDLVSDGLIPLEGVDAGNSEKVSVEEYVSRFCESDVEVASDLSKVNLYDSKLHVKIWVYSSLGSFVDFFSFTQNLNDPSYTNEAGMLQMYFEMKPDKNGDVRTESGRLYATGSYVYKVEAEVVSNLKCTLPPVSTGKKKGDVIKNKDDLLKSFGYKRPEKR